MQNTYTTLPDPVHKYLLHVIKNNHPIRNTRILQRGELRFSKDKKWIPFEANQVLSANPPEFVWNSKIRIAPFLNLKVQDAYRSGNASAEIRILLPIHKEKASPELNAGALQRYLGECLWMPTALLPKSGVTWTAIDDRTALATLKDCGSEVSLHFHFNEMNEVADISTPGRYRKVRGKFELTPWKVRTKNYVEKNGVLIPVDVEVEWELSSGTFFWFKAEITCAQFEFETAVP